MTRFRSSVPQLPPPQVHAFAGWGGVVNLTDPAASDPTMLWDLVNLRLDTGVVAVRPGLTAEFGFASVGPALGMGLLRFPPTNTTPENRQIVVHGTRNEYQSDGSTTTRGALYVYAGDGTGAHDITPALDTDLTSALDGTSNPAFFAQFNGHLYGVNGTDGLFRWDGGDPETTTALMIQSVETPPAPAVVTANTPIAPAGFSGQVGVWASTDNTHWTTTYQNRDSTPFGSEFTVEMVETTTTAQGKIAYTDYGGSGNAGVHWDLTSDNPEYYTDNIVICIRAFNNGDTDIFANNSYLQFNFMIGSGDPTGTVNGTNSFSWACMLTSSDWSFLYLPLDVVTPTSLLSNLRWFGVQCVDPTGADNAYTIELDPAIGLPGRQGIQGVNSNVFYKVIAEDSVSTVQSQATAGTEQTGQSLVVPAAGDVATGTFFESTGGLPLFPRQRTSVTVDFTTAAETTDTYLVYRAVIDPSTDATPEAKTYYLVQTVTRSQASQVNNQFQFYDNFSEADLLTSTPLPLAWDVPGVGALAPKYVLAKDTRLVFFKSDTYPNSIWLSNIGVGEQVPQVLFTDGSEPGTGGRIDIGYDDGDEITAVYITNYEFTIFKRNGIWKVRGRLEGTANETWDVIKIFGDFGCIGPRCICNMPTGLLFYSGQAIYELPHGSNTPMELPMSRQIQRTFDAIPTALKSSVALGFHPVYDLVFATIPNADDTMPSQLYVWDRRLWMHIHRRWIPGMWSGRWMNGAVGGMAGVLWYPSMFLWDGDDFYIARGDVPVVDRFKRRERDAVLYTDWEQPIPFSLLTPWVTPAPLQKVRLLQARTQWTYLNEADNVDELLPGDAPPVLSAALTMRTRPHGAIGNTNFNYTVIPLTEYPNGLFLTGQAADANRELPNTLEGTAFQAAIDGTCSGAQRVNLLGIWVSYMARGPYR